MFARGVVTEWHLEEGWGVIAAGEPAVAVWTHFSAIQSKGYKILAVRTPVELEYELREQDGYHYRALEVRPINPT
jgi:CspA family cold shock protein